jgi:1-acyl-sn-glycerol-3-phosphate acyltransferase
MLNIRTEKPIYWFTKPVVLSYTHTMLNMDVRKHTEFPTGAKIIAANHPSTTDPFFVAAMLRQQAFILIKDILFQVPLLGEYLRRSGHIPVKAGSGQAAIDAALAHLRAGRNIIIFPEGAISPLEGGFHQAHTGVARLALMSGAPVVPVGIHLLTERLHSFRSNVKGQVEWSHWYLRGPYNVTTGQPLYFHGDAEDRRHVRVVADAVMHHIIELSYESASRMNGVPGMLSGAFETL